MPSAQRKVCNEIQESKYSTRPSQLFPKNGGVADKYSTTAWKYFDPFTNKCITIAVHELFGFRVLQTGA